jgi:branched-chain amino acid transport system ATP-binding protein
LLEVVGLAAGYLGERVIEDINVDVRTGEAVAIVGSNGAGKTTLFRVLAGLLRPMQGRVVLDGKDLTRRPAHRVARIGIAYVPAERHLFPAMTVKTNLVLGAYPRRPDRETLALVYDLFPRLKERLRQQAGTLSGGEQQMLALGRALMSAPRLLLLDEPSLGLAPVAVDILFDALEEIHASGVSILLVEQNVTRALAISQNGHLLSDGRIVRSGPAKELLDDPEVQRICLGV